MRLISLPGLKRCNFIFLTLRTFFIITVILFFSLRGLAQDIIIYKDGRRISCRITAIDSTNLYCRIGGSRETPVPRNTVHKYYLSRHSEKRLARGLPPGVSRDKEELFLFGGSAAFSSPVQDFASMDINSETSGLAMRGLSVNGMVMLKAGDVFGFKVMYRSQSHQFATQPICNALTAAFPGFTFSCDAERWRMNGVFGGMSLRFPIRSVEGLRMTIDADVGMPRCHFPTLNYTGYTALGSGSVRQSARSVTTGAWCVGAGLSYRAGDQVALAVFAEYVSSSPEFEVSVYSNGTLAARQNYLQKMTVVNVGLGLFIMPSNKKNK